MVNVDNLVNACSFSLYSAIRNEDRQTQKLNNFLFRRYKYRFKTLSELIFHSVLVLLYTWCSDYLHNTDTDFDGELSNCATQMQIQLLDLWESIAY